MTSTLPAAVGEAAAGVPAAGVASGDVRPLRIVAFDLSLTGTGIAGHGWTETLRAPDGYDGHDRLRYLRDALRGFATVSLDVVVVEGPSYRSTGPGHHANAGLWWMFTHDLWQRGLRTAVVPPSNRAKYATGKGNASKEAVLIAAVRRFSDYEIRNNNEADAVVLRAAAMDHYGQALTVMPSSHRVALDAVDWPELVTS